MNIALESDGKIPTQGSTKTMNSHVDRFMPFVVVWPHSSIVIFTKITNLYEIRLDLIKDLISAIYGCHTSGHNFLDCVSA